MMRSSRRTLLALAAVAAPWLVAGPAAAQMAHIPDNDWRQPDRHDALTTNAVKASFAFEVRLGTYLPNIDSEFRGTRTPFQDAFGADYCLKGDAKNPGKVSPRLYFGLEADALPVRIPYVGIFGIGLGWGYTSFSNYARLVTSNPTTKPVAVSATPATMVTSLGFCAQQSTSLMIMPMHASLVLRVDELMRRTGVPIVPYGKAGAGFSFWRASNEAGTEQTKAGGARGIGLSPSLHFALGGMLSLNFIDPRASARLDETTGIHHAYVFGEWYSDTIPLSTQVLRVGASSWVAGIAVDL